MLNIGRFPDKPCTHLAGNCIPTCVLATTRQTDPVSILRHCHELRDSPLAASCALLVGLMGKRESVLLRCAQLLLRIKLPMMRSNSGVSRSLPHQQSSGFRTGLVPTLPENASSSASWQQFGMPMPMPNAKDKRLIRHAYPDTVTSFVTAL